MAKKRKKRGVSERERKRRALQSLKDGDSEARPDAMRQYCRQFFRQQRD